MKPTALLTLFLFLTQFVLAQSTEGLASFYADRFHNKPTSTGEVHDKNGFMAASKEYDYGTILEVTNVVSGESVNVRVNDCGPHHPDRILDLSRAAAERIGILKAGVAMVRIRVIEASQAGPTCHRGAWARALKAKGKKIPTVKKGKADQPAAVPVTAGRVAPPAPTVDPEKNAGRRLAPPAGTPLPTPAPVPAGPAPAPAPIQEADPNQVAKAAEDEILFGVQVGAFGKVENATRLSEQLASEGFENVRVVRVGKVSRVFAGLFYFPNQAEAYKKRLREAGHTGATVRRLQ